VTNVLTVQRGDFLTIGILIAAFFATNGIEALRVSLNRAYRVSDMRSIVWLRFQSLAFVFLATVGFVIVSILLVFLPLVIGFLVRELPWMEPYVGTITVWRFILASLVIVLGLVAVHLWLPSGRRRFVDIVPGILFTLIGWVLGSTAFAAYLSRYSSYASTYAGLASIMIALVFLYIVSVIFIMGGELNAAIDRHKQLQAAE
jgi:membrane protein